MTASIAVALVQIVVPHPGAARETPVWAAEEGAIDFRRDPARGGRCTTAFAAMELKERMYLYRHLWQRPVSGQVDRL